MADLNVGRITFPHGGGPAFQYSALLPDEKSRQLAGTMYADNHGMTLRDYFAAKAIAALIGTLPWRKPGTKPTEDTIAADAYKFADAMLKARESNG